MPQTVASAVGVVEQRGRSLLESLTEHLRGRRLLLLLDNCEHLAAGAGAVSEHLLATCPDVRILATSRQPLEVDGETVWQLPPLPLPGGDDVPVEELLKIDSVRLFVDRAAKAAPDFELSAGTAPAVADICRQLVGIPLAIQLVVAELRHLSVQEVASHLHDWLLAGEAGAGTADTQRSRQKTMYAAIDWSHQLLADREKLVFARLAVFVGGCTLEAAETVCGAGLPDRKVLDVLGRLVDRSLVVADRTEGATRFRLLEPVREFARAKLAGSGEEQELRSAHAGSLASLAARGATGIRSAEQVMWLETLDRDQGNIRDALNFLLSGGGVVDGMRLVTHMQPYWFCRGRFAEGRSWFERALEQGAEAPPEVRAAALTRFANLIRSSDHPTALGSAEEAVVIGRALGNQGLTASALQEVAVVEWGLLRTGAARRHYEECIALAHEAGDEGLEALALSGLTDILVASGELEAGIAVQVEVVAATRKVGDPWEIANDISLLGHWRTLADDFEGGLELLYDARARFREMSSPWGEGWTLCAIRPWPKAISTMRRARTWRR